MSEIMKSDWQILRLRVLVRIRTSRLYRFVYVHMGTPICVGVWLIRCLRRIVGNVRMGMTLEQAASRATRSIEGELDKGIQDAKDRTYLASRQITKIDDELESQ